MLNVNLENRLIIPSRTKAILWDMDGVLVDSLELDYRVCNQILKRHFNNKVQISNTDIKAFFAYSPTDFWKKILNKVNIDYTEKQFLDILTEFREERLNATFTVHSGIKEILVEAKLLDLKLAVVSNNPHNEIVSALKKSKIYYYFDLIVGNDIKGLKKKPKPDFYIHAANVLNIDTNNCTVIEDSEIGCEAGHAAGCCVIGVATGGTSYTQLEHLKYTDYTYTSFQENNIGLWFNDIKKKVIKTPNDFVSHMIEHIAWRLCSQVNVNWNNDNWLTLGYHLGKAISKFPAHKPISTALGMIDDGSAEIRITTQKAGKLQIVPTKNLDVEWFKSARCEQLNTGEPLFDLMEGISKGISALIEIRICSFEDPHHTWEGIFRSFGIALNKIYTPYDESIKILPHIVAKNSDTNTGNEIRVIKKSKHECTVIRGTAESNVTVNVDFTKKTNNDFSFNVNKSINVDTLPKLLEKLSSSGNFSMQVNYNETFLSSSHVVMEDTALVLGRALLEILTLRMIENGVNGAGSSLTDPKHFESDNIRVGISVEGRKFWLFYPFNNQYSELRQKFLVGQNINNNLRSEDLDDFIDGLAGGLACSIIVHVPKIPEQPSDSWEDIFSGIGTSLKEAFSINPYRRGVPPGVKATLS